MFPHSSEFFEFVCIKLISRCILQINCEECWDILFLASCITIHYVPGKSNFQRNVHLHLICLFFGMYEQIFAMLVSLHLCTHALCNEKGERHIIYENAIDYTPTLLSYFFPGCLTISRLFDHSNVCNVCSY